MKKTQPTSLILLILLYLLSGCSSNNEQQHEIIPDISSCSQCKMLISDERFAAYLTTDQTYLFDDFGCMIRYMKTQNTAPVHAGLMNYENKMWLNADSALIIKNAKYSTPMNYGFIAVSASSAIAEDSNNLWEGNFSGLKEILRDDNHD